MAGGSTGEAAARKLIGQEMDTAEILFEGVAEGPMAAPSLLSPSGDSLNSSFNSLGSPQDSALLARKRAGKR
jgi:hypothetical protein